MVSGWCFSEWVWNLRKKFCCITSGEWNVSRVLLQELDNKVNPTERVPVAKWIASHALSGAVWNGFPVEEVMTFLSNYFKGSFDEKMGRQQKEDILWWNVEKRRLRRRGLWKICVTLHVWWSCGWILSSC